MNDIDTALEIDGGKPPADAAVDTDIAERTDATETGAAPEAAEGSPRERKLTPKEEAWKRIENAFRGETERADFVGKTLVEAIDTYIENPDRAPLGFDKRYHALNGAEGQIQKILRRRSEDGSLATADMDALKRRMEALYEGIPGGRESLQGMSDADIIEAARNFRTTAAKELLNGYLEDIGREHQLRNRILEEIEVESVEREMSDGEVRRLINKANRQKDVVRWRVMKTARRVGLDAGAISELVSVNETKYEANLRTGEALREAIEDRSEELESRVKAEMLSRIVDGRNLPADADVDDYLEAHGSVAADLPADVVSRLARDRAVLLERKRNLAEAAKEGRRFIGLMDDVKEAEHLYTVSRREMEIAAYGLRRKHLLAKLNQEFDPMAKTYRGVIQEAVKGVIAPVYQAAETLPKGAASRIIRKLQPITRTLGESKRKNVERLDRFRVWVSNKTVGAVTSRVGRALRWGGEVRAGITARRRTLYELRNGPDAGMSRIDRARRWASKKSAELYGADAGVETQETTSISPLQLTMQGLLSEVDGELVGIESAPESAAPAKPEVSIGAEAEPAEPEGEAAPKPVLLAVGKNGQLRIVRREMDESGNVVDQQTEDISSIDDALEHYQQALEGMQTGGIAEDDPKYKETQEIIRELEVAKKLESIPEEQREERAEALIAQMGETEELSEEDAEQLDEAKRLAEEARKARDEALKRRLWHSVLYLLMGMQAVAGIIEEEK